MNKQFIVYKVTFPNKKCYIGITSKGLEFRKKCHYREARRNRYNFKFHNALLKYNGIEKWEILDTSANSWEELCNLEKKYIEHFKSFLEGYNCSLGGDGRFGSKHSQKSIQKMKGPRPQTSIALKNKPKSQEHKNKLSEARKGYVYSKSLKEKHSEHCGGKRFNVFKNEKLIGTWTSKSLCALELNINARGITGCLNQPDIFFTHKGYTFKYLKGV